MAFINKYNLKKEISNLFISMENSLRNKIIGFLFFIVIFFLTRQVPFAQYSIMSNIALIGIVFILFPRDLYFALFTCILIGFVGYSMILENNFNNIIRFFIILWTICAAYYIKVPNYAFKILFILSLIQCFIVILCELYLVFIADKSTATLIRLFSLKAGWGDIYTFNNYYYRVQIKGNAIIPFIYMLSYYSSIFPQRRVLLLRSIYLLAIICSGQFAFIISIFCFHIYQYFNNVSSSNQAAKKIVFILIIAGVILKPTLDYVDSTLERKKESSTATRVDQTKVLMKDLKESNLTFLFGKGLGNTLSVKTQYRDYTNDIYFELQTLYIINQLGILPFIAFLIYNIYLTKRYIINKDHIIIYLFYLLYAITNPYVFDTTHIVVILTLCSIKSYKNGNTGIEQDRMCSGFIQT